MKLPLGRLLSWSQICQNICQLSVSYMQDKEQAFQQLYYLNQFDKKTNQWRDLTWMDFMPEVLDKYRNNELCEIGSDRISFLRHNKSPISTTRFIIKNNVLMMYA